MGKQITTIQYASLRIHLAAKTLTCWVSIWSALFRTTLILSSWPRKDDITLLNSSLTSSLWGSNKSRMRSHFAANHDVTPVKSYALCVRCFSPDRTPGVSTKVMCSSSFQHKLKKRVCFSCHKMAMQRIFMVIQEKITHRMWHLRTLKFWQKSSSKCCQTTERHVSLNSYGVPRDTSFIRTRL